MSVHGWRSVRAVHVSGSIRRQLLRCATALCSTVSSSIPVRVRFAPSPTGQLHLGGLRTALYNYLFARKHRGVFIVRIEDTDRERVVTDAAEALLAALDWAGLRPDEAPGSAGAYGPYTQSERLNVYAAHASTLLVAGDAYRCFCSIDRLKLLRREQMQRKEPLRYDGRCRGLNNAQAAETVERGKPFVIRFKLRPTPDSFTDLVFGEIHEKVHLCEGDPVIIKSDGYPTYHFANVVDDHLMAITHVIRAQEWLQSTVKHLQIYAALNYRPPTFLHLPWLSDKFGAKLSKRDGAVFVDTYRQLGYLPAALLNFVTRNGAGLANHESHHVYSLDEMIDMFDASTLHQRIALVFDQRALDECNRLCLSRLEPAALAALARRCYAADVAPVSSDAEIAARIAYALDNERVATLDDVCRNKCAYLWRPPATAVRADALPIEAGAARRLALALLDIANGNTNFDYDTVVAATIANGNDSGRSLRALRAMVIGQVTGPPIRDLVQLFARREWVERLKHFLDSNDWNGVQ